MKTETRWMNIATWLIQRCRKFSINSERTTYPDPPSTSSRVILPPGTNSGSFTDGDEFEYLSDQDIAAGITPKSTNTASDMKQRKTCCIRIGFHFSSNKCENNEQISTGSHFSLPPYVPAKSKALKNISGFNNESISGGIKVSMYGRGLFWPLGSCSTENQHSETIKVSLRYFYMCKVSYQTIKEKLSIWKIWVLGKSYDN